MFCQRELSCRHETQKGPKRTPRGAQGGSRAIQESPKKDPRGPQRSQELLSGAIMISLLGRIVNLSTPSLQIYVNEWPPKTSFGCPQPAFGPSLVAQNLLSDLLWPPKTYLQTTTRTRALLIFNYFASTCTATPLLENLLWHNETYFHTRKATLAPEHVCTF